MKSAHPRQHKVGEISKQIMRERCVNGPPEIVAAEQSSMTLRSDYSMFDFNELERRSPSTVEDEHHDIHRLAGRRIVQETVMSIEGNEVGGDSDDDCPGGQFSDTEDDMSTNASLPPGCRADKARIRNLVRRRQQPDRTPSSAWLEPEEETAPIREDASRVVFPASNEAGRAETQEELKYRPIMAVERPTSKKPQMSRGSQDSRRQTIENGKRDYRRPWCR